MIRNIFRISAVMTAVLALQFTGSAEIQYTEIDPEQISRYNEDRIVYQQIETEVSHFRDNSYAALLIIRDSKSCLIMDGYDSPDHVNDLYVQEQRQRVMPGDLWQNKIDGDPDFMIMSDRRKELIRSSSADFVKSGYGELYSTVRTSFLKRHVARFKTLILKKEENTVLITRTEIPRDINDSSDQKYKTTVKAKGDDDVLYYAEDADGDGITETFTATISDGFNWGYNSGPNIINITCNSRDDIKALIGDIAMEAYNGSPEYIEMLNRAFDQEKAKMMVDDVYKAPDPVTQEIEKSLKTDSGSEDK